MIRGVGMPTGPRVLKSLISIEIIQARMMVATFTGNFSKTIISCYSPTNVCDETDLITSYNDLSSLVRSTVPSMGGDRNAQIGKNVNNKFSSHNSSNRNGEHPTGFTQENKLKWLSTKFQKRKWGNSGSIPTQITLKYR